ncbi:toxin [Sulfurimonas hongkongensis]|uniref:Toxin n=1 Tax=Sulfurimonas hongkongensis TaxID=1172190 RepID=T0KNH5_9BACT|nr:BrnT family toxin [Sulfurimonas hongkongensis]EQB34873.1 toxin [Sulfurimonas hongkongensis]
MKYKYDSNKSLSNKQKHGIDFEDAKLLWNDDRMVEILTSYEDEERFINIGKINSKFYTVVSTIREDKIRIISARRARKKEIEIYES